MQAVKWLCWFFLIQNIVAPESSTLSLEQILKQAMINRRKGKIFSQIAAIRIDVIYYMLI